MNKKEIKELRDTFKEIDKTTCTRLCGCYVGTNKEKIAQFSTQFLTLPERTIKKYHEIFRQSLYGVIGDKLINLTLDSTAEDTGFHKVISDLRQSECKDEKILNEFYNNIIENIEDMKGNYLILTAFCCYDIPGGMKDSSEYQYRFVITSICPVKLTPAGLCYSSNDKNFKAIDQCWSVSKPKEAFLFPAFNDRCPDTNAYLYYVKTKNKIPHKFISDLLESKVELTNAAQKDALNALISSTWREDISYEVVNTIQSEINDIMVEHAGDLEPYEISKSEIRRIFEDSGASAEQIEEFNDVYEDYIKNDSIKANAVSSKKRITFKNESISLKIDSAKSDMVEIQKLSDGSTRLSITLDEEISCDGIILGK